MQLLQQQRTRRPSFTHADVSAEFAGQLATAVWLGKLTEEAAWEALWSYALACHRGRPRETEALHDALLAEYRCRREGQEACG